MLCPAYLWQMASPVAMPPLGGGEASSPLLAVPHQASIPSRINAAVGWAYKGNGYYVRVADGMMVRSAKKTYEMDVSKPAAKKKALDITGGNPRNVMPRSAQ
jgi:hypothetical protein